MKVYYDKDITRAGDALAPAERRRIHTFIATSPLHMEVKLRMTPDQVLEQAVKAVKLALQYTDDVEFSAEDGYRSELPFLAKVCEAVIKAGAKHIERELMLVKLRAVGKEREELKRTADIFRGRIIDVTEKSYTIELTGNKSKLDAFLESIDRTAILETVRTGSSGIGRGERILRV